MRSLVVVLALAGSVRADAPARKRVLILESERNRLPNSTSIPDPWSAIADKQPIIFENDRISPDEPNVVHWMARDGEPDCSAAHDHCFPQNTWLAELDGSTKSAWRVARATGFGRGGPIQPFNVRGPFVASTTYTAYRTVPQTTKNLVVGSLAFALPDLGEHPANQIAVFELTYHAGIVERVDRKLGHVYFKGLDDPYAIESVRVAVVAWRPGGAAKAM